MTSTAFDAASIDDLPPYNDTYVYMLLNCFTRLTDFRVLLDPDTWGEDGGGASPFDSQVAGEDILTGKTLAYWDFLVAHSPWNQTTFAGVKVTTGIKDEVVEDMDGCEDDHDRQENMRALDNILKEHFGNKRQDSAEDLGGPVLKRRRELLEELEASSSNRRKTA